MKKNKIILGIVFILGLTLTAHSSIFYLKRFTFNEDKPLVKWSKMILKGEVEYVSLKEGENGFVKALSKRACSALYYRISFNIKDYPMLSWKWKVSKFPDLTKALTDQERDDYAARMYVIFPFLTFSSSKFIEYVWSENLPVGTILTHPTAKNVKLIVARSGKQEEGWVSESRNVWGDYLKAFGEKPRLKAGAVAIMSDADNSNTEAEANFDEIAIASLAGAKRRLE